MVRTPEDERRASSKFTRTNRGNDTNATRAALQEIDHLAILRHCANNKESFLPNDPEHWPSWVPRYDMLPGTTLFPPHEFKTQHPPSENDPRHSDPDILPLNGICTDRIAHKGDDIGDPDLGEASRAAAATETNLMWASLQECVVAESGRSFEQALGVTLVCGTNEEGHDARVDQRLSASLLPSLETAGGTMMLVLALVIHPRNYS